MASRLPITVFPLNGNPGKGRETTPVEMRMLVRHVRLRLPVVELHRHLTGPVDEAFSAEIIDLVLLKEKLDPGGILIRDFTRALDHLLPVIGQPFELKTKVGRAMLHQVIKLGVAQKRLGRDAAPVETGSASAFFLDAGDAFTKLGRPNCPNVTGRPAANHNQIVAS